MSAIFISHSSRDDAVAAELRERLAEQGHHSVFLDFDPAVGIPAGRDWERELYLRLRACQAVVVLCSEHSMASRWCFVEITHAKAFGKHIFPLKIDDCTIDSVLTSRQVLDLTVDPEDAYRRLWRGLEVAGLDPKDAFDWDGTRPPYPGLLAFQEDDAAIFFGRDREIHRGLESLNRMLRFGGARAMLVLGASGSGKSSLVRAGLLPRLRRNLEEWLVVAPFRPLGQPLRELARALDETSSRHGQPLGWRPIHHRLQAAEDAAAGGAALNELARDLRAAADQPRATVLLVIDQAEELLAGGEGGGGALFLPLLRAALEADDSTLMTVLTLRSDLLGAFQKDPAVRGFETEDLRVGPIPAEGVAQIIEGPAQVAGLDLEPGLTQAMVDDTEADGSLPLLAFALRELYELYKRRGRGDQLAVADYRETLGGLAGSVARAAESVYAAGALSGAQQQELQRAFLALARINKEGRYVRQPAPWTTLPAAAHPVLERFVAARLLIFRDEGGERILEVAHEAIFRSWQRLKNWLDEDREFFLWRRRLETASREWHRLERDVSGLLQGPALAEARSWLGREGERLREDERELIEASAAAALRQRRQRIALLAATLIFLTSVATGGIALWRQAESQRARAADLGRVSLAGDWLDEDPTRAALALLDLENPTEVGTATALMSEALQQTLAFVELRGHQGGLPVARFDDTGDQVVTASADGTAAVWSVEGTRLATLRGHGDRLTSAAFSPDGERIVTASNDGTARVWRSDGTLLSVLEGHDDRLTSVAFSPDGERVVTASEDATARLWHLEGDAEPILLAGHEAGLTSAAFSPDDQRVVTASKDTTARIWPAEGTGEPIILSGHGGTVSAAAFSVDGGRVVTASSDGTARVWRSDGGSEPIILSGHDDALTAASFDRSGLLVVTASEDATARLWRLDSEAEPLILAGHDDALTTAAFNRKGDRVVTASEDETARLWATDREGELLILRGHRAAVAHAAFSPDGLRLVTTSLDGTARLWETAGESQSAVVLQDQENQIVAAQFSPDGGHVATGLQDHSLWVWNTDGTCPTRLGAHEDTIRSLAWNATGDRLVSAAEDGAVRVWYPDRAGDPVSLPDTDRKVTTAALSPLGNRVAIASEDGTVRLWFAGGAGEPVVFAAHEDAIESVAFSPDGRRIVTASQDQTARVHAIDGGTPVELGPHRGWVTSATFDPLGERVVTVSTDRRTRVWRADGSGKPVVLNEHSVSAGIAAFGPRSQRIATLRQGGTVRIWNADGSGRSLVLGGDDEEIVALMFDASGERLVTVAEDGRLVESLLSADLLLRSIAGATRVCLRPEERERSFNESPEEALASYEACERSYGREPLR